MSTNTEVVAGRTSLRRYSPERVRIALAAMHEVGFGKLGRRDRAVVRSYERGTSRCD